MWSSNVPIWFISNNAISAPHYDGVYVTHSIFFKHFFNYITLIFHFIIFMLRWWRIHLHHQNIYRLCLSFNSNDSVIMNNLNDTSIHFHAPLLQHVFQTLQLQNNTLYNHHFLFHLVLSIVLHWHLGETPLSSALPFYKFSNLALSCKLLTFHVPILSLCGCFSFFCSLPCSSSSCWIFHLETLPRTWEIRVVV